MGLKNKKFASFMSANTPGGFFSYFEGLQNPEKTERLFFIKGGPGTGKSTLLRKIGEQAEKAGFPCEYLVCSADPDSLDGIIIDHGRVAVIDATPPHALEPKYPVAFEEVVDLLPMLDAKGLSRRKKEIVLLSRQSAGYHQKTRSALLAAAYMKEGLLAIGEEALLGEKIERFLQNRKMPERLNASAAGKLHRRFLSAVCAAGVFVQKETLMCCEQIIGLEDALGSAAAKLLNGLAEKYLDAGYDVYAYDCPLSPGKRIEHLVIPELSIAYTTLHENHCLSKEERTRTLHCNRFYDSQVLSLRRGKQQFYEKMLSVILEEAASSADKALKSHKLVEHIYGEYMDFEKMNQEIPTIFDRVLLAL